MTTASLRPFAAAAAAAVTVIPFVALVAIAAATLMVISPCAATPLTPTQVAAWFDSYITPFENANNFDAFFFAYINTVNGSVLVTPQVRGNCYDLNAALVGPANANSSLFRIGSVGKILTTAALLQLYERGQVNLTDPVTKYLPGLSSLLPATLTVLDTCRHTVGLDERILNIYLPGNGRNETLVDGLKVMWTTQLVAPGTRVTYTNLGVTIMGAVVEEVSGQRLIDYVNTNIASPLNISAFKFHVDLNGDFSEVCYPRVAQGAEPYQIRTTPSGDYYSTGVGIATFLGAILNGGKGVFQSTATADLMLGRLYPANIDGLAFIFTREQYGNNTILGKDGGVFHFSAYAALYPDSGEAMVAAASNGIVPSRTFIAEDMSYRLLSDNGKRGFQPTYPYPVPTTCNTVLFNALAGSYFGSRAGQWSPVKLIYLFNPSNLRLTPDGCGVIQGGFTFVEAQLPNGTLPSNQVLLQANTSTTGNNSINFFSIVTYSTAADGAVVVQQVEQFSSYLSTLQPMPWYDDLTTVLVLLFFYVIAQCTSAIGLPIVWVQAYRRRRLAILHHSGLLVSLLSWFMIFFAISLAALPSPNVYFNIQPGFVAIQVLAIMQFAAAFTIAIACGVAALVIYRSSDLTNVAPWAAESGQKGDDGRDLQPKLPWYQRYALLLCAPFAPSRARRGLLACWTIILVCDIIGYPGLWALNFLSFTLW